MSKRTIIGYKLTRATCPGWMFAGTTPDEVATTIRNELESEAGLSADECDAITIAPYETTAKEIEMMPEFPGW